MQEADGSFTLSYVGNGDVPVPQVYASRDTGYFVRALVQVPPGKNLLGEGAMISWKDSLKVWCEIHNVPNGGYHSVTIDEYVKNSPLGPEIGLEFAEMYALMDGPGYDGGDPSIIHPKDVSQAPTS